MAREDYSENGGGGTVLGFGVGLVAGAALGVGLGLLLAPKEGLALRRDLGARARKLRDETVDQYHRVGDVAAEWADQGKDIAARLRTAAAEGLREARKRSAAPADPRSAELAGVDGTAERT